MLPRGSLIQEECLKVCRYYKDRVEERKAIMNFLNKPKNQNFFDVLGKVFNDTRSVECYHKERCYTPRTQRKVWTTQEEERMSYLIAKSFHERGCIAIEEEQGPALAFFIFTDRRYKHWNYDCGKPRDVRRICTVSHDAIWKRLYWCCDWYVQWQIKQDSVKRKLSKM